MKKSPMAKMAEIVLGLEGKTLKKDSCVNCIYLVQNGTCNKDFKIKFKILKVAFSKTLLPLRSDECIKTGAKKVKRTRRLFSYSGKSIEVRENKSTNKRASRRR